MTRLIARCSSAALLAAAMAWLALAREAEAACNAPNGVLYELSVTLDVQDFYCAGEDATINVTVTAVPTVPGTTPIPYPNPTYYWSALGPGPTVPGSTLISGSGTASFGTFSITLPAAELFVSSTPNDWHINIVVQNAPDQYAEPCARSKSEDFTVSKVDLVIVAGSSPADDGPALVKKGSAVTLMAKAAPSGASFPAGSPDWSITQKPVGSTVSDPVDGSSTAVITPDKVGKYVVQADCGSSSDTFEVIAWQIEFQEDTSTHHSIEGYDFDGNQILIAGVPTNFEGPWGSHSKSTLFTDDSAYLYFHMTSDCAGFRTYMGGGGSWLQPSGEIRYDVYLNVGNATSVPVTISADWSANGTVTPESTLIANGAGPSIVNLTGSGGGSSTYQKAILGGSPTEYTTGVNPISASYTVSGSTQIGTVEAGVTYHDYGADPGDAAATLTVIYSVSPY